MTRREDTSLGALDALRKVPVGVAAPAEVEAERRRLVPWLEERVRRLPLELAQAERRKRMRRALVVGGLAAAAVLLVVTSLALAPAQRFTRLPRRVSIEPYAMLVAGAVESGALEVLPGSRLGLTSRVRTTGQQTAIFEASTGYRLALARATEVVFAAESGASAGASRGQTRLRLVEGGVEVAVPRLASGQTLEVVTADATVRVRGTRFSVRLLEHAGERRTCVEVSEGLVEVVRADGVTRLRPTERLGCDDELDSSSAESAGRSAPSVSTSAGAKSSLAEENRLLSKALGAERAGRSAEAKRAFSELVRRFPSSRFLPEARDGLERLSRRVEQP